MHDAAGIVVYKPRGRDLKPLREGCERLDFTFFVIENEDELKRLLNGQLIRCLIIPLGSRTEGTKRAREFVNAVSYILTPEYADILIIYSSEDFTPEDWPNMTTLDPRPIKDMDDPNLVLDDKQWKHTLETLNRINIGGRYPHKKVSNIVVIEAENFCDVPFISELPNLFRAAFKDMSRISVKPCNQGLSGSIACVIQPYDISGNKCKPMFAKIYADEKKAYAEQQNTQLFRQYIDSVHYPEFDDSRRYRGIAYSLIVTNLVLGPSGNPLTFLDMAKSDLYTNTQTNEFIEDIFTILDKIPSSGKSLKLIDEYLYRYLTDHGKCRILESYNCYHKWFGHPADDLTLLDKILKTLPSKVLNGSVSGLCHGDFHSALPGFKWVRGSC